MRTTLGTAWALIALGCASQPAAVISAPLGSLATLEVHATPVSEPHLDGPVLVSITLREGARERAMPGAYLGGVSWDGAAALLDADGVLWRADLEGESSIAEDVSYVPVVSLDGAHLAYATSDDGLSGDLHVLDALGDRAVAQDLGSIGALVFSPDGARVAFVGAARSGRPGVWIADARGREPARCLTNCSEDALAIALPATPIRFAGAALSWDDASGQRHQVSP